MWSRDKGIPRMDNDASTNSTIQDTTVFHRTKNRMYKIIQMFVCRYTFLQKKKIRMLDVAYL